jgi:glyceraldehyde 3-phosphate dehydrogenase
MARKIAINGFGRIGRQVFRILHDDPTVDIVAINDLTDPSMLAHLLKYDSVHRRFNADIVLNGSEMVVDGKVVHLSAEKDPSKLPWAKLGVELVLECTGIFTSKEKAQHHITAGAQYVIISAPARCQ